MFIYPGNFDLAWAVKASLVQEECEELSENKEQKAGAEPAREGLQSLSVPSNTSERNFYSL